jgi:hypothetical protein
MIAMLLFLGGFLGCHAIGSGQYTIYVKPEVPPLRWVECQQDFQCLPSDDYTGLRIYAIEMDGLVDKYQKQTEIINGK